MENFPPEIQELIRQRDANPGSKESIVAHARLMRMGILYGFIGEAEGVILS